MNFLQEALALADESYLIGMSNKGIYKRACKDLEHAEIFVNYQENFAEVNINGEVCNIKNPLWESSCSCPSRTVCRHLISAILFLREQSSESEDNNATAELEEDLQESLPDLLKQELQQVSQAQLKKALGNQTKFMIPWIQEQKIILEESSILSGILPDENQTAVRIVYPLAHSTCACHKKELCAHKAIIILAWQVKQNLIKAEDFLEQIQCLDLKNIQDIQDSAKRSYDLLYNILKWGLVRIPENMPEHLEASAVQSHALKMADAERMLREIGSSLAECRDRRAVFQLEIFLQKICTCAECLLNLQKESILVSDLGQFKKTYQEYSQDLEILPIGQRKIETHEYIGVNYYFLNLDYHAEQKFLIYSDIRPVFYEGKAYPKSSVPWNADVPIAKLMHNKMVLKYAKISDGKLSSSKETKIVFQTKAILNCEEIRNLIYFDFRKLAIDYSQKNLNFETDRLCFVKPSACLYSGFDTHAQCYQMRIADNSGNVICMQVRYKAENKKFINLLENIGNIMLKNPEQDTVWLCSVYFENGKLNLYPIEIYDFISMPDSIPEYSLPSEFENYQPNYINQIFMLLQDVQNELCALLQSGSQSAYIDNFKKYQTQAEYSGMHGFSDLLQELIEKLEQTRHVLQDNSKAILDLLIKTQKYIRIGIKKLEIFYALDAMKFRKEDLLL
ncbi:MAG: hypothetical protein K2G88_08105 [Oscillospiraceae bacterium]|nr:hypothetical protein [Oscillospiraceae bacterium]